jgi:transcriptional regulator with XRE-family HTH domain
MLPRRPRQKSSAVDKDKARADAKRASAAWRARIGAGVKAVRTRTKISQAELANVVGVDMSTISDIERGDRVPNYATIESMADFLAVTIDELVGRSSAFAITPGVSFLHESRLEALRRLVKVARDAEEELKRLVEATSSDDDAGEPRSARGPRAKRKSK